MNELYIYLVSQASHRHRCLSLLLRTSHAIYHSHDCHCATELEVESEALAFDAVVSGDTAAAAAAPAAAFVCCLRDGNTQAKKTITTKYQCANLMFTCLWGITIAIGISKLADLPMVIQNWQ